MTTAFKLLLVLAAVSAASADTASSTFDQIADTANDLFRNFTSFWGFDSPPSGEQVLNSLHNLSDSLAARMSDVVRTIQTEIEAHSGQASEAMQSASANLNQTIRALQSPENKRRVEELRSSVSTGMQTLAQETSRIKDAVAQETQGLRGELHQAFNEMVQAAQRLSDRLQTAIQEHQAQHGKK